MSEKASGFGVADSDLRVDDRFPDRTITDGRRTLGFVWIEGDADFTATDAGGVVLGSFTRLDKARAAVVVNARGDDG